MIIANLPKSESEKVVYSLRLYEDTLNQLSQLAGSTGINVANLVRISVNNFLQSKDVVDVFETIKQ